MNASPFIVTVTTETFNQDVIEASYQVPVLVDFWADWCAPCRSLMPLLAKLADEYQGQFILAKVNTDEERQLAAHFGIRSLPTVQLFKDGQPVDQFLGALPEAQIRDFLDRHIGKVADSLVVSAQRALQAGDLSGAAAWIEQVRTSDPDNKWLQVIEAEFKAASGDIETAEAMLERVPPELHHDPEVVALRARLRFASLLRDAPAAETLRDRLARDPSDSDARQRLAAHLVVRGDYEGALEQLFLLMTKDRAYGDDAGRKGLLAVFDLLGGQGELVSRYRSRMMAALY
ncbi:thioredoxin [Thioalkalicoccus limnaeus]|uniref:Thioredoxin n=1 Tax=Thioalkalicoccus limnaeus TaxID=120681 RepID=A0ABV4BCB6_9GAMM